MLDVGSIPLFLEVVVSPTVNSETLLVVMGTLLVAVSTFVEVRLPLTSLLEVVLLKTIAVDMLEEVLSLG